MSDVQESVIDSCMKECACKVLADRHVSLERPCSATAQSKPVAETSAIPVDKTQNEEIKSSIGNKIRKFKTSAAWKYFNSVPLHSRV